jgi:hypothetical protein
MSEVGELVGAPMVEVQKDECPFCGKSPHDSKWENKKPNMKVVSRPKNLGDLPLTPPKKKGCYGRARHHIIPAIQCFAMLPRLVAMASMVNYNINAKENGIGLPTVWNPYKLSNGTPVKFGDLKKDDPEKKRIQYDAMRTTKAQWHVGNHHWKPDKGPEGECGTEDMADEGKIDHGSYDMEVIKRLFDFMCNVLAAELCEDPEDNSEEVKKRLEEISNVEIRGKLNNFKTNPSESKPFFVSLPAYNFAKDWTGY